MGLHVSDLLAALAILGAAAVSVLAIRGVVMFAFVGPFLRAMDKRMDDRLLIHDDDGHTVTLGEQARATDRKIDQLAERVSSLERQVERNGRGHWWP